MEVTAPGPSSPTRRRRPGHRGGRRRRRRAKTPKPADPVSAIPAAAPPPPRPVPLRTQVVSALVLFVPSTGCYNYFILTSDGAWLPAIPLYPLSPGLPTGTTAC